jgi:TPR repeat protein
VFARLRPGTTFAPRRRMTAARTLASRHRRFLVCLVCVLIVLAAPAATAVVDAQVNPTPVASPADDSDPAGEVVVDPVLAASQAGDAESEYQLGLRYEHGDGVPIDYAAAAAWYRKSADHGHVPASAHLGSLYVDGRGVAADPVEAARLVREAAEKGDPAAMDDLSLMYLNGRVVSKDAEKALEWCRNAAGAGHPMAAYRLAFSYYRGDAGVPVDHVRALAWLIVSQERLAAYGDVVERRHELAGFADQVADSLSNGDIDAAQALAREVLSTVR